MNAIFTVHRTYNNGVDNIHLINVTPEKALEFWNELRRKYPDGECKDKPVFQEGVDSSASLWVYSAPAVPPAAASPVPPDVQAMQKELGRLKTELEQQKIMANNWRETAKDAQAQAVAYKTAKAENDERYMLERDKARQESLYLLAENSRLKKELQLAKAVNFLAFNPGQPAPASQPARTCHKCGKVYPASTVLYAGGGVRLCPSCIPAPMAPASEPTVGPEAAKHDVITSAPAEPAPLAPRLAEFAELTAGMFGWMAEYLIDRMDRINPAATDASIRNWRDRIDDLQNMAAMFSQHCKDKAT